MVRQRPRLMIVSPIPVLPVIAGGPARLVAFLDYFKEQGFHVDLVTVVHENGLREVLEERVDKLWIYESPMSRVRSALPVNDNKFSLLSLLLLPARIGWKVSRFFYRGGRAVVRYLSKRSPSFIESRRDRRFDEYAARVAQEIKPAAVIASYVWTARCLDSVPPSALKIIDTIDIQHMRAANSRAAGYDMSRIQCSKEEEVEELLRADILLAIQKGEMDILKEMCPSTRVMLFEHALKIHEYLPSPEGEANIFFVGNLYEPNVEGLKDFLNGAWPQVREAFPQCTLSVCGKICDAIDEGIPGIRLEGIVPELEPYYRAATIVINPVPFGTGLKIKTVEALAYAKCLVTTECGITGLPTPKDGVDYCVLCPSKAMAEPIIALLNDPARRSQIEEKAYRLAVDRFSPESAYGEVRRVIEKVPRY